MVNPGHIWGTLDIGYDVHLFAIRYVFKERINSSLKAFAEGWNHHPLSTEGNMSPAQLWVRGLQHELLAVIWNRKEMIFLQDDP